MIITAEPAGVLQILVGLLRACFVCFLFGWQRFTVNDDANPWRDFLGAIQQATNQGQDFVYDARDDDINRIVCQRKVYWGSNW